jgi:2-alkyl-3-oxoalkanoate reductase
MTVRHVLVTNATGLTGYRVVKELLLQGLSVTALGRNLKKGQHLQALGANFYPENLWDFNMLKALCQQVNMVVHCPGLTSLRNPKEEYYKVNSIGTRMLIAACLQSKVNRLIHISSASIYHNGRDRLNVEESAPLPNRFVNNYAWSMYLADQYVQYAMAQGLPAIILRSASLIGRTHLLNALIYANQTIGLPLINQGQALSDMTSLDNLVNAVCLSIKASEKVCGQIYHISNQQPMTIELMVDRLFKALQKTPHWKPSYYSLAWINAAKQEWLNRTNMSLPILTRYHISWLSHTLTLSTDKAQKVLGYQPDTCLKALYSDLAIAHDVG